MQLSKKGENKKLTKQADNIIPRIFPTYSPNPSDPNFSLYCKYQLIRYKPWKISQDNAWNNIEPTDENFIMQWQKFLKTLYAQKVVPNWFDELQEVIKSQQDINDEPADTSENNIREEWMILSDLHTPFQNYSSDGSNEQYNWNHDSTNYTDQQIGEMPTW